MTTKPILYRCTKCSCLKVGSFIGTPDDEVNKRCAHLGGLMIPYYENHTEEECRDAYARELDAAFKKDGFESCTIDADEVLVEFRRHFIRRRR